MHELNEAAHEFLALTEDLTLLKSAHETAREIAQAVDGVQQIVRQSLTASKLVKAISESEAAALLDELVDSDPISELEDNMLAAADGIENVEVTQFLAETMDKVERKYNLLLEKVHTYNALLKG